MKNIMTWKADDGSLCYLQADDAGVLYIKHLNKVPIPSEFSIDSWKSIATKYNWDIVKTSDEWERAGK